MSAQLIFNSAPLGSIVTYCDGTRRNGSGRLIAKKLGGRSSYGFIPGSFTLHEGDIGCRNGVVVLSINRTFPVNSGLSFAVVERPAPGSVRILDRDGADAELVHLAASRIEAEAWLLTHRYSSAVLDEVTADETGAALVEGRAVA